MKFFHKIFDMFCCPTLSEDLVLCVLPSLLFRELSHCLILPAYSLDAPLLIFPHSSAHRLRNVVVFYNCIFTLKHFVRAILTASTRTEHMPQRVPM